MPLDYDRHVRMTWAHRFVVAFHSAVHLRILLLYRKHSPLVHYLIAGKDQFILCCGGLTTIKLVVFVAFWTAHAVTTSSSDSRDHVAVMPTALELPPAPSTHTGRRRAGLV